ncbi:hypothetical protein HZS_6215 [Henneguya salminicola]|nr:hypothetical protein HZS_6215 [Henneguya salminicola]
MPSLVNSLKRTDSSSKILRFKSDTSFLAHRQSKDYSFSKKVPTKEHTFIKSCSDANIYCHECILFFGYIKGNSFCTHESRIFYYCQKCKISFHTFECMNKHSGPNEMCIDLSFYSHAYEYYIKELILWTNQDVLAWLYSCNLDQLRSFVIDNNFNGSDLNLWRNKTIDTLLSVPPDTYLLEFGNAVKILNNKSDKTYSASLKKDDSCNNTFGDHLFVVGNFEERNECYICNNLVCGITVHKFCLAKLNSSCKKLKEGMVPNNAFFKHGALGEHAKWVKRI